MLAEVYVNPHPKLNLNSLKLANCSTQLHTGTLSDLPVSSSPPAGTFHELHISN